MKAWSLSAGVVGACAVLLAARPLRASPDESALRRAGALVWEMTEKRRERSDGRLKRGITPDRVRRMAETTSAALARNRDALAALAPRLAPDSRFAQDVSRFIR